MQNVAISIKGTVATITVDLSKQGTPSASGKSDVLATTHGNQVLATVGDKTVKFGLNVYTSR